MGKGVSVEQSSIPSLWFSPIQIFDMINNYKIDNMIYFLIEKYDIIELFLILNEIENQGNICVFYL